MKTLSVEEATSGLGRLVDLAMAGERIQIRKGESLVELRPANVGIQKDEDASSPLQVFHQLQESTSLRPQEAEEYLDEVRAERLAS